ncbi:MAG: hypothetical protein HYV27_24240 [Candidatus Hydrogenedentes bacterium]|nr:hypothetical protein [Candidatus Hydrogenedentota bacterium]
MAKACFKRARYSMPYNDPEPEDPMALNGVAFEATPDAALEAAYTFAEELARLGQPENSILYLFQSPQYQGPYSAFQALGIDTVTQVIKECCTAIASCRAALRDCHLAPGKDPGCETAAPWRCEGPQSH